ncbi:hypothetical protein Ga0074812_14850 [Parafrankia irregularis]|uniref:Helix-turn-helix domain-containing protein n=1 Tax=Parafrankia irregularis TaxID=795642 RepID=A0A0S4R0Z1_9ACTN|nr:MULTISPECIES: hypothetical protein [Parafrankia]MBE3206774.1 hypothetical protein [Parafrankia sp. CH37]CUU60850.1 hypothetical protein Ga0074812_14850 [Parafrankia irregularis]
MARPVWTSRTPEDQAALDALVAAVHRADTAEEEMWVAAQAARAQGVPADRVAALVRRGRSTVYRELERRAETDPA